MAHRRPLSVKLTGIALVTLSYVALKPTPVNVAPGAMVPFQLALAIFAVTPFWVKLPFHPLEIDWPSASCNWRFHPLVGVVDWLVMSMPIWKFPGHAVITW